MGALNIRNYSQKTNFMCGSIALELLPFYVTSINIPGITPSLQTVGGRDGASLSMSPANVTYSSLSMEVLIDEDYSIFKEIVSHVHVKPEMGTFENKYFDFWMVVTNDMGKVVMKIEYYSCLIESIGDVMLAANDDTTENTFSVDIKFDYYKIITGEGLPVLRV